MIDAPSCAPRQLRKAASRAGAPAASTASPTPRRPQGLDRVGPQRDARADLAQLRRALEHEHVAAGALQRDRRREAGDARADDQGAIVHASTLRRSGVRSRRRSRRSVGSRLGSLACSTAERRTVPLSRASSSALGPRRAARWSSGAIPGSASRRCSGTRPSTRRACGCCAPWGSRPSPSSRSLRCTSSCGRSSTC